MAKVLKATCYLVLKPKFSRYNGEVQSFSVGKVLQKATKAKGIHTVAVELEVPSEVFSPPQMKAAVKLTRDDVETQVKVTPVKPTLRRKGAYWTP